MDKSHHLLGKGHLFFPEVSCHLMRATLSFTQNSLESPPSPVGLPSSVRKHTGLGCSVGDPRANNGWALKGSRAPRGTDVYGRSCLEPMVRPAESTPKPQHQRPDGSPQPEEQRQAVHEACG